jgi:hypothetical protein
LRSLKVLEFPFHFTPDSTISLFPKERCSLIASVIGRLGTLTENRVEVVGLKNTSKDVGTKFPLGYIHKVD